MLKTISKNLSFFLSLLIVLFNYILCLVLFHSRLHYDDWQILQYVSGTLVSDEPAEFLIYTHVFIGLLIKHLFQMMPTFPWYGAYLHFILFLSTWFILFAILLTNFSTERILLFLLFFYVVLIQTFSEMRYSTVSAYATISGFFLFFSTLARPNNRILLLSALMLFIGFLIRKESGFVLICATFMPITLFLIYSHRKQLIIRHLIIYFCSLSLLIYFANTFEFHYYSYHEQLKRLEMNKKVNWFYNEGMLHYNQYPTLYKQVGFSKTDYFFGLYLYNYFDKNVFTEEKIDTLLAGNDMFTWNFIKMRGIKECYHEIINVTKRFFFNHGVLLLLVLSIGFQKIKQSNMFVYLLTLLNIGIGLILLYFFLHLSYAPNIMYASFILVIIYFTNRVINLTKYKFVAFIIFIIFILSSLKNIHTCSIMNKEYTKQNHLFLSQLSDNHLYILWDSNDAITGLGAFDDIKQYASKNLVLINYYTDATTVLKKLEKFGVKNINKDIVNRKDILFAPAVGNLPHYINYMKQHYGYDLQLVKKQTFANINFYGVVK